MQIWVRRSVLESFHRNSSQMKTVELVRSDLWWNFLFLILSVICVASKKLKAQKSEFYFVNSNHEGTCMWMSCVLLQNKLWKRFSVFFLSLGVVTGNPVDRRLNLAKDKMQQVVSGSCLPSPLGWETGQKKLGQSNSELKYWTWPNFTIELAERIVESGALRGEHTLPIFANR